VEPIVAACPRCKTALRLDTPKIACERCGYTVTRVGGIPLLLPRPDDHVVAWRRQLGLLDLQSRQTLVEFEASGLSTSAQDRVRMLGKGVRDQMKEVMALVGPALGGPLPPDQNTGLPRGIAEHIHFLYRDWGWPAGEDDENKKATDALAATLQLDQPLGKTLVLGAGACRLAYDLHFQFRASPIVAVDIDPFLFVIAEAVVRGRKVALTEATVNVQENAHSPRTWDLAARKGPLDETVFLFLLADGISPPLPDAAFDTVVTPWFIDQVPPDLPAFLATLRRLLRPGGRWINQGPLLYPPEAPLARRYPREELFDLSARAGLPVRRWSAEVRPHLHSPLYRRGKIEWVLTFDAVAGETAAAS
jgi:SAM-dependent methyltransferase